MENNSKKIVIFTEKNYNDIIMEILESNGLKETWDDYLNKINQKKEPFSDILYELTKSLFSEQITSEEFLSSIKNRFNIKDKPAKEILNTVKEKLAPVIRILNENDFEEAEQELINAPLTEGNIPLPTTPPPNPSEIKKLPEKITKQEIDQALSQKGKKNNTDAYREPIE